MLLNLSGIRCRVVDGTCWLEVEVDRNLWGCCRWVFIWFRVCLMVDKSAWVWTLRLWLELKDLSIQEDFLSRYWIRLSLSVMFLLMWFEASLRWELVNLRFCVYIKNFFSFFTLFYVFVSILWFTNKSDIDLSFSSS